MSHDKVAAYIIALALSTATSFGSIKFGIFIAENVIIPHPWTIVIITSLLWYMREYKVTDKAAELFRYGFCGESVTSKKKKDLGKFPNWNDLGLYERQEPQDWKFRADIYIHSPGYVEYEPLRALYTDDIETVVKFCEEQESVSGRLFQITSTIVKNYKPYGIDFARNRWPYRNNWDGDNVNE